MLDKKTDRWVIIGKDNCKWCFKAMTMFQTLGVEYDYYNMDRREDLKDFLISCGLTTAPQIYLNGYLIGGYDDTVEWFEYNAPPSYL